MIFSIPFTIGGDIDLFGKWVKINENFNNFYMGNKNHIKLDVRLPEPDICSRIDVEILDDFNILYFHNSRHVSDYVLHLDITCPKIAVLFKLSFYNSGKYEILY